MADISKCFGLGCNQREKCYRYTAPNNEHWQSYAAFDAAGVYPCADFWPNDDRVTPNTKRTQDAENSGKGE